MNYIIIIGAFQAFVVLCMFLMFRKEKRHDRTLNWLLACIVLHLGGNFLMNTVFPHYETHKEFITFIGLMYAPLLRLYAGQLAGSRNLEDRRPMLLFLPAMVGAVAYFSIAVYTFSHHGKTPSIIKSYNSIVGYAILLSFLLYSTNAIRLSTRIPYFWKAERTLVRLIAAVFLILFVTWAIIPNTAPRVAPGIVVKWVLQIIFYSALLVICLAIGWVRLLSLRYINTVISTDPVFGEPGYPSETFSGNEMSPSTFSKEHQLSLGDCPVLQAKIATLEDHIEQWEDRERFAALPVSEQVEIHTGPVLIETVRQQVYKSTDGQVEENTSGRKQILSSAQQQAIAEKVELLMQQNLFTDPALTLDSLAVRISVPRHHLSEVLNVYIGKSFYVYLNEYRIHYVAEIMRREQKSEVTPNILSLAFEAGFHSKSSFNQYFKKVLGCTPSAYLNGIQQDTTPRANK
ncbi:helix-turn-helix domain-containing protein [Dyadobacter sp. OTU695]|uniref:helix-turn-helix domain-containing protein n=1 Tax=Dyadobacter sp. OTU695 TaxID=3043860 RepID=UPI00313DF2B8